MTAADSHVLRRSPLIGHRRAESAGWACLVAGSGIRFGDVIENGRVLVDERQ